MLAYLTTQNLCDNCKVEVYAEQAERKRQRVKVKAAFRPAVIRTRLPKPKKPLKVVGKQSQRWKNYRAKWLRDHPDDFFICYYCNTVVPRHEITLDHKIPRSRRPDLRFVDSNIVPACGPCNNEKGSMDDIQYMKLRSKRDANAATLHW